MNKLKLKLELPYNDEKAKEETNKLGFNLAWVPINFKQKELKLSTDRT